MKAIVRNLHLLAVFATAGCGAMSDFDDIRHTNAKGDDFDAALTREYKALALFELDDMQDLLDADWFRDKAMASAASKTPAPDRLDQRTLPYRLHPELAAARARLVGMLNGGGGRFMPAPAARAQARFDCWLEQQEEDFQPDDIQKCRDGFYAALVTVERGLAARDGAAPGAPVTRAAAVIAPAAADAAASAFTLFFDFDSADLAPEHAAVLDAVAAATRSGRAVRLMVAGHADRAGPDPYNMTLSRRRAEAIERALVGRGLERNRMTVVAFGERRPRVITADGTREPLNRRVEIVVGVGPSL